MRITPYTPESELHRFIASMARQQAVACVAGAINVGLIIYWLSETPTAFALIMSVVNGVGAWSSFALFNSASKARVALRELIALKRKARI